MTAARSSQAPMRSVPLRPSFFRQLTLTSRDASTGQASQIDVPEKFGADPRSIFLQFQGSFRFSAAIPLAAMR